MKFLLTAWLVIWVSNSLAQNSDTVKIKEVEIFEKRQTTQFELLPSQNFNQTLKSQSFAFIKDYGPSMISTITVRGLGASHTTINWDGLSVNNPMLGMTDLSLLTNFIFDNAEQLESNNLFINATGNFGSGFNFNQNKPDKLGIKVISNYSSLNNVANGLRIENKIKQIFFQTNLSYISAQNRYTFFNPLTQQIETQLHAKQNQKALNFLLGYYLNKNTLVEYKGWIQHSQRQIPSPIGIFNNTESQVDYFNRHLLKFEYFKTKFQISNRLGYFADSLNYFNPKANDEAKESRSLALSLRNNFNASIQIMENLFLKSGIQWEHTTGRIKRYGQNKAQIQLVNSFINPNFRVKRLEINPLIKLSYFSIKQKLYPYYNLNLGYSIHSSVKMVFNYGLNYRFPTLNDLFWQPNGNINLNPEKGNLKDVSLIFSPFKEKYGSIKITGFYNSISNFIQWLPNAHHGYFTPVNLKKVNLFGFEISGINKIFFQRFYLKNQLFYAYTISRPTADLGGFYPPSAKQLLYTPIYNVKNNLSLGSALLGEISLNYQFISWRATSTDNYEYLPWYQIIDVLYLKSFNLKQNKIQVSLGINNLLNTDYMVIANRPMPKRYFLVGLQYSFNK